MCIHCDEPFYVPAWRSDQPRTSYVLIIYVYVLFICPLFSSTCFKYNFYIILYFDTVTKLGLRVYVNKDTNHAGDNQSLKIQVARPGIEPRSSCSASQELNHSATTAPTLSGQTYDGSTQGQQACQQVGPTLG